MLDEIVSDLEIAAPEVVRQAGRDFAAALAATPQFQAFRAANARLRQDAEAQAAILAYQQKQQALQMMLMLNAVSPEDRAELNRLYQAFAMRPSVQAYIQAETGVRGLCQAAGDRLSRNIGFDFAAACSSGCC